VGPALLIGFLLYPFLDVPTFVIANVVLDVEPLLVILLGLPQPLHGPFHSLTLSIPVALILAVLVHGFRRFTRPIMVARMLPQDPGFRDILKTSVIGVWTHVILDALLYPEMRLFYPLTGNPLLGLVPSETVTTFCLASFLLSLPVYLVRVYLLRRRSGVPDSGLEAEFEEPEIAYPVGVMGGEFGGDDVEIVVEEPSSAAIASGDPKLFIGCDRVPRQWGVIGRSGGSLVAADLNEPHIVFVCGKQGSGKGYTIGVLCEMLLSRPSRGSPGSRSPPRSSSSTSLGRTRGRSSGVSSTRTA
jgi:membrane-bound metal-dependent hydrolase YbcI (DUF457 family)